MNAIRMLATSAVVAVLLAGGCSKPVEQKEAIRPVRTVAVGTSVSDQWSLAGEVRARYETRLAFRLPGLMLERRVEVGQRVAAGETIANIDARDARLAESQARAQLAQAQSQAALAEADLKRFRELRSKNFISQAEFDRRQAQAVQAREQVAAARAAAMQAKNQVGYAVLVAPHAGVITALEVEAGQVLAAGQTVARLARPEELEVAVSVPEHRLEDFRRATALEVRLWSAPTQPYVARLREFAPVADPATRTYAARVSLAGENPKLAIGMTAELRVRGARAAAPRLPLSALFHRDGKPAVWVVASGQVALVPVVTGSVEGNHVEIVSGLEPGQQVVTAGVNRLRPGQRVALLEADAPLAARKPASAAGAK